MNKLVVILLLILLQFMPTIAQNTESTKSKTTKNTYQSTKQTDEQIFTYVEVMPKFPGGNDAFLSYVKHNIRYPEAARDAKIQGKIFVSFVVTSTGHITDVKIMKGVNPELDEEAIRVIEGMPRWIPGKQHGKNCAVKVAIPIVFTLD